MKCEPCSRDLTCVLGLAGNANAKGYGVGTVAKNCPLICERGLEHILRVKPYNKATTGELADLYD